MLLLHFKSTDLIYRQKVFLKREMQRIDRLARQHEEVNHDLKKNRCLVLLAESGTEGGQGKTKKKMTDLTNFFLNRRK